MENLTSETGTEFPPIEMNLRDDAGTQVDSNITCEVYTQTADVNKEPNKISDVGAEKEGKKELHCRSYWSSRTALSGHKKQ